MDAIPEPQVESKFPDCVAMKLHLKTRAEPLEPSPFTVSALVSPGRAEVATHPKELDLSLTINFGGEQEIEVPGGNRLGLPGGRATFGVRRGQLRFTLQNCKLPLEKIALSKPFKVSIVVEKEKTRSNEIQASTGLDSRSVVGKVGEGSSEKTTDEVYQVKKVGSEEQPAWVFEAYGNCTVLEGMLPETLLGTLKIAAQPCEITAGFTVRGDDIQITWGKIGGVENITRNKLAVIERFIALRHIKPLIEAEPICQGGWKYG